MRYGAFTIQLTLERTYSSDTLQTLCVAFLIIITFFSVFAFKFKEFVAVKKTLDGRQGKVTFLTLWNGIPKISMEVCKVDTAFAIGYFVVTIITIHHKVKVIHFIQDAGCRISTSGCGIMIQDNWWKSVFSSAGKPNIRLALRSLSWFSRLIVSDK